MKILPKALAESGHPVLLSKEAIAKARECLQRLEAWRSGKKRVSKEMTRAECAAGMKELERALELLDKLASGESNPYPYLYWWDACGIYHQHYISGGQIVHISSEPVAVKSARITLKVEGEQ